MRIPRWELLRSFPAGTRRADTPGFAEGDFLFLGLTKTPFGDYFLFFLGFLSKSKFFFGWFSLKMTKKPTIFFVFFLLGKLTSK